MQGGRWRQRIPLLVVLTAMLGALVASFAYADKEASPLVMGVFPRRNFNDTSRMFTPLARELSKRLHCEVRLETAPDFPSFWRGVEAHRYHIVHFNQYQYVRAHKEFGYRVFGVNKEFDSSSMRGVIVVRRDSQIQSLRDLRGKRILFGGDRTAMMAYIVPTYMLRQAGLGPRDYIEEFAVTPFNTAIGLYYRRVDAATGSNAMLGVVKNRIDIDRLRVLSEGTSIAGLPWVVREDVSAVQTQAIARAMFELGKTEAGRAALSAADLSAVVPAEDSDYDSARKIIRTVLHEAY